MENVIMAISENAHFIWSRTENGWVENFFKKDINWDGDQDWIHQHSVKYLDMEDIESLTQKLQEAGFNIIRA